MSRLNRTCLSLLCLIPLCLAAPCAHAFERQWHLGLDTGAAALSYNGGAYGGLGAGAHLTYGLTDSFNALVEIDASSHSVDPGRPSLKLASGSIGAAYTLDIIRWVPYFGVLAGGYRFSGADLQKAEYKLGFQFALGLDYEINRSWSVGAQLRYHTFSDDPLSTVYLTSFLRASYVWGW